MLFTRYHKQVDVSTIRYLSLSQAIQDAPLFLLACFDLANQHGGGFDMDLLGRMPESARLRSKINPTVAGADVAYVSIVEQDNGCCHSLLILITCRGRKRMVSISVSPSGSSAYSHSHAKQSRRRI